MDYDKLSWIKASKYRQNILKAMSKKPKTPKDIAEETDYYLSHVSNTITDLKEKNLTKCLTPDKRKGKLYTTTKEGEKIVDFLKK
ncbi:putative transcriptional regulator [Methanonatronarchaeum thermophilum]|uniref:Putative transcriptional regulator n=1 Tax=Methanonatronarchaeum thermophilum TaxID=1927129 RepID=A0A1Y3GEP1_9EURY|nr:transcriptional regulator [Methanonatronarchaeum thermophilum]OUJ18773.1 putative transcriptional regulator [Methanonatronarchaeum thermophilum]